MLIKLIVIRGFEMKLIMKLLPIIFAMLFWVIMGWWMICSMGT